MGAIQSAINQGLATAGILYSQSDLAEQRNKDFADKREIKDIDKQLNELSIPRETLQEQSENFSKTVKAISGNTLKNPEVRKEVEDTLESMKARMDLYQGMTTDLSKRKFELTKDPIDLRRAQAELELKRSVQSNYDEIKAIIAQKRTRRQQKMAKSIKPRNSYKEFYKELREMEINDKQQQKITSVR